MTGAPCASPGGALALGVVVHAADLRKKGADFWSCAENEVHWHRLRETVRCWAEIGQPSVTFGHQTSDLEDPWVLSHGLRLCGFEVWARLRAQCRALHSAVAVVAVRQDRRDGITAIAGSVQPISLVEDHGWIL